MLLLGLPIPEISEECLLDKDYFERDARFMTSATTTGCTKRTMHTNIA